VSRNTDTWREEMNIDRDQLRQLGMQKRKVYTLRKNQEGLSAISITTPHIEQVLALYSEKLSAAMTSGCFVEHDCKIDPKRLLGKTIIRKMTITTQEGDTFEWVLLCEET
jgi:hypothetical protein